MVVDPLAEYFEDVAPYNYGANNPILMIDPDGMAADTARTATPKPIELKEIKLTAYKLGGKKVMESVSGFWPSLYYGVFPREFTMPDGRSFEVDNNGKTLPRLLTGTPPGLSRFSKLDPKSIFKLGRNLKSLIRKGKIPSQVKRVDVPKLDPNGNPLFGQQTHIHLKDGRALNLDGTWKHGEGSIPKDVVEWVEKVIEKL